MDKLSYALGLGIGRQLAQMGANDINIDDFALAIKDVIAGNELKVSNREAQTIVQSYFAEQEKKLQAERAENGKAAREAGEKYLAENAKKDGVVTLASGLQYQVIKEGEGRQPKAT
ncbi:MAG: FKBP-type peptidyl-prolyl cis-trans isomerase N-terminal domain-containing protein, partial [Prevotella sp.]|nr:FKBP-type peptidyl-prolyl cis-trans isomerase N-terminal domain-containing protein [Prevotella sp.]